MLAALPGTCEHLRHRSDLPAMFLNDYRFILYIFTLFWCHLHVDGRLVVAQNRGGLAALTHGVDITHAPYRVHHITRDLM